MKKTEQNNNEKFGELRSLVHSSPSENLWERLLLFLNEKFSVDAQERILSYLGSFLKKSGTQRETPREWFSIDKKTLKTHFAWQLANVANLECKGLDNQAFLSIMRSDVLHGFVGLKLSNNKLKQKSMAELSINSNLRGLTILDVSSNSIRLKGVMEIVKSHFAFNLRSLSVQDVGMRSEGLKTLECFKFFENLEDLNISWNDLSVKDFKRLCNSIKVERFKRFGFAGLDIGEDGVRCLSDKDLSQLEVLWLNHNNLSDKSLGILSKDNDFNSLKSLILSHNGIANSGLRGLFKYKRLLSLKSLDLSNNNLNNDAIDILVEGDVLANLECLSLARNYDINFEGIKRLANCEKVANLRRLHLDNGPSSVEYAGILANSPYLSKEIKGFWLAISKNGW